MTTTHSTRQALLNAGIPAEYIRDVPWDHPTMGNWTAVQYKNDLRAQPPTPYRAFYLSDVDRDGDVTVSGLSRTAHHRWIAPGNDVVFHSLDDAVREVLRAWQETAD